MHVGVPARHVHVQMSWHVNRLCMVAHHCWSYLLPCCVTLCVAPNIRMAAHMMLSQGVCGVCTVERYESSGVAQLLLNTTTTTTRARDSHHHAQHALPVTGLSDYRMVSILL